MSGVRKAALAVLLSLCFASWTPGDASAGEQWIIEIQRYLDGPEKCPSAHTTENHSYSERYNRADTYGRPDRFDRDEAYVDREVYSRQPFDNAIQNSALSSLPPAPAKALDTSEVSCLQGTRVARQYGFHHIEVVSCDEYDVYVYEALRGREPWRILVDPNAGNIVEAQPLY